MSSAVLPAPDGDIVLLVSNPDGSTSVAVRCGDDGLAPPLPSGTSGPARRREANAELLAGAMLAAQLRQLWQFRQLLVAAAVGQRETAAQRLSARYGEPMSRILRRAALLVIFDAVYMVGQYLLLNTVPERVGDTGSSALLARTLDAALISTCILVWFALYALWRRHTGILTLFAALQTAGCLLMIRNSYLLWLFLTVRILMLLSCAHARWAITRYELARQRHDRAAARDEARLHRITTAMDAVLDGALALMQPQDGGGAAAAEDVAVQQAAVAAAVMELRHRLTLTAAEDAAAVALLAERRAERRAARRLREAHLGRRHGVEGGASAAREGDGVATQGGRRQRWSLMGRSASPGVRHGGDRGSGGVEEEEDDYDEEELGISGYRGAAAVAVASAAATGVQLEIPRALTAESRFPPQRGAGGVGRGASASRREAWVAPVAAMPADGDEAGATARRRLPVTTLPSPRAIVEPLAAGGGGALAEPDLQVEGLHEDVIPGADVSGREAAESSAATAARADAAAAYAVHDDGGGGGTADAAVIAVRDVHSDGGVAAAAAR